MAEQSIDQVGTEGKGITREQRGIQLFRNKGSQIVWYVDGTFGVPSETEEGVIYIADPRVRETGICECPDFTVHGETCKHIYSAIMKRAELLAIAEKEAQERKERAEKRKSERIKYTPEQADKLIAGLDRMIS